MKNQHHLNETISPSEKNDGKNVPFIDPSFKLEPVVPNNAIYGLFLEEAGDEIIGNEKSFSTRINGEIHYGAKIQLLDLRVYKDDYEVDIIKVKVIADAEYKNIGKTGYITFGCTSFRPLYNHQTRILQDLLQSEQDIEKVNVLSIKMIERFRLNENLITNFDDEIDEEEFIDPNFELPPIKPRKDIIGKVDGIFGDIVYGDENRYNSDNFLFIINFQEPIHLLDLRVYKDTNMDNIIKIKVLNIKENTDKSNTGWMLLNESSFRQYYVKEKSIINESLIY